MARQPKSKITDPASQAPANAAAAPDSLEEQIRRRAYEIYLARGGKSGDPVADWMQAEQEVRNGARPSKAKARKNE